MYKSEVDGRGGIYAKVVADSVAERSGRITTMELRYPRFIHSEFMTHRMFSRNASSSRAIPVKKMMEQIENMPAMPIHWGINRPGMQAHEEWTPELAEDGFDPQNTWETAARDMVFIAQDMQDNNIHKQVTNRLLEPFQFIKVVVTATEWDNFFALRIHKDAQPEIQELATCMKAAMDSSEPQLLDEDQYHLPYIREDELANDNETLIKCSVARCARVSYLNHDQSSPSIEKDIELYNMLGVRPYDDGKGHVLAEDDPVHLSPFEHVAKPMPFEIVGVPGVTHTDRWGNAWSGNFCEWIQYRQEFTYE